MVKIQYHSSFELFKIQTFFLPNWKNAISGIATNFQFVHAIKQ